MDGADAGTVGTVAPGLLCSNWVGLGISADSVNVSLHILYDLCMIRESAWVRARAHLLGVVPSGGQT